MSGIDNYEASFGEEPSYYSEWQIQERPAECSRWHSQLKFWKEVGDVLQSSDAFNYDPDNPDQYVIIDPQCRDSNTNTNPIPELTAEDVMKELRRGPVDKVLINLLTDPRKCRALERAGIDPFSLARDDMVLIFDDGRPLKEVREEMGLPPLSSETSCLSPFFCPTGSRWLTTDPYADTKESPEIIERERRQTEASNSPPEVCDETDDSLGETFDDEDDSYFEE